MLHLFTIRLHYDFGFCSVVSMIDEVEQQIETLTLANQSSNYTKHLEQSVSSHKAEQKIIDCK